MPKHRRDGESRLVIRRGKGAIGRMPGGVYTRYGSNSPERRVQSVLIEEGPYLLACVRRYGRCSGAGQRSIQDCLAGPFYGGRRYSPVVSSRLDAGTGLLPPRGDGGIVVLLGSAQLATVGLGLVDSRHLPRLDVLSLQLRDTGQ